MCNKNQDNDGEGNKRSIVIDAGLVKESLESRFGYK